MSRYALCPYDDSHLNVRPVHFFDINPLSHPVVNELEVAMRDMNSQFRNMDRHMNSVFRELGLPRNLRGELDLKPQIVEDGKDKKYVLNVHMGRDFSPEDVKVSVKDHVMSIDAKHEKKSEDGNHRVYQEVTRKFKLPDNVNVKEVKSHLTHEGILRIEAPVPQQAIEAQQPKPIPIKHE